MQKLHLLQILLTLEKLQTDLRLIERNLSPEYFTKEFEKLQSNKYRIMSELYKDVQALRTIGFKTKKLLQ